MFFFGRVGVVGWGMEGRREKDRTGICEGKSREVQFRQKGKPN